MSSSIEHIIVIYILLHIGLGRYPFSGLTLDVATCTAHVGILDPIYHTVVYSPYWVGITRERTNYQLDKVSILIVASHLDGRQELETGMIDIHASTSIM